MLTFCLQNAANYVSESVQGAGSKASHETNKQVAKDSDASLTSRATAAKDSVGDKFDQCRIAHLHRREVDGHVNASPAPGIGERAPQHELAKPPHQPGLLSDRHEHAWRNRAAHQMGPAQQGFGADDTGAVG